MILIKHIWVLTWDFDFLHSLVGFIVDFHFNGYWISMVINLEKSDFKTQFSNYYVIFIMVKNAFGIFSSTSFSREASKCTGLSLIINCLDSSALAPALLLAGANCILRIIRRQVSLEGNKREENNPCVAFIRSSKTERFKMTLHKHTFL